MENKIKIKNEYNSLEKILDFVKTESTFPASIGYDVWNVRRDGKNLMEKCVIIKKSSMHGVSVYFSGENTVESDVHDTQ